MFIMNNPAASVLDTFRFDGIQIHFKEFHALRTYEAFQQIPKIVALDTIINLYNSLEIDLIKKSTQDAIVRLVFTSPESYELSLMELKPWSRVVTLEVCLEPRAPSGLGRQNFKWDERTFWEKLMAQKKTDAVDVVAVNAKDQVVETSRFNIFIFDKAQECVYTPALSSGCINGVYRRFSMHQKQFNLPFGKFPIIEKDVLYGDLARYQLFVANSVRGVLSAELV